MQTPEYFTRLGANTLPGHLGIVITHVDETSVYADDPVRQAGAASDEIGTVRLPRSVASP